MNELIEKLVIETLGKQGVPERRAFGHWAMSDEQMVKFSELIVKECISIIGKIPNGYKDYRNQIEDAFRDDTIADLKEHFGVEK